MNQESKFINFFDFIHFLLQKQPFKKRLTEEEKEAEERERKANLVSHQEFKILTGRVDTMESSIGNIVNRV